MWVVMMFILMLLTAHLSFIRLDDVPALHTQFDKRELELHFGVDYPHQVPKYHATRINGTGNYQNNDNLVSLILSLRVFDTILNLNVSQNHSFIADTHVTEYVGDNGTVYKRVENIDKFSSGKINGDDNSNVVLHHTEDGIAGTLRTSDNFYFVNPIPRRLKSEQSNHIVYSVLDLHDQHPLKYLFHTNGKSRVRRSIEKPPKQRKKKTMELLIAADYRMYEYYSKLKGEYFLVSYMLAAANILSGMFRDPTLSYPIDVVIVRSVIFKTDKFQAKTIRDLLKKFSSWCKMDGVNNHDESSPGHFDDAVLWTRGGCNDGCALEGVAYYGTVCGDNAQGIGKDRGLMSSITLAHEIAHILKVDHDAEVGCPDGRNIMATGSTGGGRRTMEWSTCSSKGIATALESSKSTCFDDEAPKKITDSTYQLYGRRFNGHVQCQYIYGKDFGHCGPYQHRCDRLFCRRKQEMSCTNIPRPPAHGTACGKYKWCIYGECVVRIAPPPPINGGWSQWGGYSACSHSCGIGVQWRTRHCSNPEPKFNGKFCNIKALKWGPERGHYRTCKLKECGRVRTYHSDGDKECARRKQGLIVCIYCAKKHCQLICGKIRTYGRSFGFVKDGTLCKKGICVLGKCKELDCTGSITTEYVRDRCGKCAGNGTSCTLIRGKQTLPIRRFGQHLLTTFPAGSKDVIIKEMTNTWTFIAVKVGKEHHFAYRVPNFGETVYKAGAKIVYVRPGGIDWPDMVKVIGTLTKPIRVYLVKIYWPWAFSKGVVWKGRSNEQSKLPNVKWLMGTWSVCTKPCAGGTKIRKVRCVREDDSTTINPETCSVPMPSTIEICNDQPCPPMWRIAKWSHCSQSCASGNQTRNIFCGTLLKEGNYANVGDGKCVATLKPNVATFQLCNKVSCPPQWVMISKFGACSTSCGEGTQGRRIACSRTNKDGKMKFVPDFECPPQFKPSTHRSCNNDIPCPTWEMIYGECTVTCGEGVEKGKLVCMASPGKQVDDSKCSNGRTPDITHQTRPCNKGLCNGYQWYEKEGSCSVLCGKGQFHVTVHCRDIVTKAVVADSKCDSTLKPSTVRPCDRGLCVEYMWKTKKQKCTKTCGSGFIADTPYCWEKLENITVDDSFCELVKKPMITFEKCNTQDCPPYDWVLKFGECSQTCSLGIENSTVVCQHIVQKKHVADVMCNKSVKIKPRQRNCNIGTCPGPFTHKWIVEDWGCNVTCGQGTHTYEKVCHRVSDDYTMEADENPEHCANVTQPKYKIQSCHLPACVPTFQWNITQSHCAVSCGRDEYHLTVLQCIESNLKVTTDYKYCKNATLPKIVPCEPKVCKPVYPHTIPFYALGCYWDTMWEKKKRVPYYMKSFRDIFDWDDPWKAIMSCFRMSYVYGFSFFALQFHGECWVGKSDIQDTYFKDGEADNCYMGSGGRYSNFIYHIGASLESITLPPIIKIGCFWNDTDTVVKLGKEKYEEIKKKYDRVDRNVTVETNKTLEHLIEWDEERILNILQSCAKEALSKKQIVFGGDTEGRCLSKEQAEKTLQLSGFDISCAPSLGNAQQYYVYKFFR